MLPDGNSNTARITREICWCQLDQALGFPDGVTERAVQEAVVEVMRREDEEARFFKDVLRQLREEKEKDKEGWAGKMVHATGAVPAPQEAIDEYFASLSLAIMTTPSGKKKNKKK
ncbi:hypothetical protein JCM8547_005683 [Rhodosporidiobolus lusitaniae]